MIKVYKGEIKSIPDLSFSITRNDIVGFYNTSIRKEKDICILLKEKTEKAYINMHNLTVVGISKTDLATIYNGYTLYRYLFEKTNAKENKDYLVEGMLQLAELSEYKEELIQNLNFKERYRLEIIAALLQEADLIILHDLFEIAWDSLMYALLKEASLQLSIVVFSRGERCTMHNFPIHYYDLKSL